MIEFRGVCAGYGGNDVLRELDISVSKGEFLGVIGPNGSGKSTFIRLINALMLPSSGSVLVDGTDTASADLFEIRKKTGTVFQNPDNQIVTAMVEDEVAFGPENLMLPADEIERRVDTALGFVGMLQYKNHMTGNLSGGQKQKIAFASAIAMEPEYCLFDEPTSLIDVQGRKEIMKIIKRLHKDGKTVIMVSHFMEEVFLADRVLVLAEGRNVFAGPPAELLLRDDILGLLDFPLPAHLQLAKKYCLTPPQLDMKNVARELRRKLS